MNLDRHANLTKIHRVVAKALKKGCMDMGTMTDPTSDYATEKFGATMP